MKKDLQKKEQNNLQETYPHIIGHHTHQYKLVQDWGIPPSGNYPVNDCHEMVMDSKERIYLLTNEIKNNILIYNKSGKLLGSWGKEYPGGHGLTISSYGEEEFLLITDHDRHQVIKTTLDGRVLMIIDYPKETGEYSSAGQYKPTETAVAPNGDIYVTDGYGLQFVIQYTGKGEYIRHWGGKGNTNDTFDCVHGIAIDEREPDNPSLLITSRNHNAFKRFHMNGEYIATIALPGSFVCRPVIKGEYIYAAVFRSGANTNNASGYITILDRDYQVISTPGGTEPAYKEGILQPQRQDTPIFIHPHDVLPDNDENLYVCQWKANKSYPIKLVRVL